jgi:hypothetical protein
MQEINRRVCDDGGVQIQPPRSVGDKTVEEIFRETTTTVMVKTQRRRVWPNPLGTHTRLQRQNGWRTNRRICRIDLGAQSASQEGETTRDTDSARKKSVHSQK